MSSYHVTFERIGRDRHPQPLCVENVKNIGDLERKILQHVKPKLASRYPEVTVDDDMRSGYITAGWQSAGEFKITEAGHPDEQPSA